MLNQRERLEKEVAMAKERIDNAPANTPAEIRKIWEDEFVQLSFDLNNYVDEEDDNNI